MYRKAPTTERVVGKVFNFLLSWPLRNSYILELKAEGRREADADCFCVVNSYVALIKMSQLQIKQ